MSNMHWFILAAIVIIGIAYWNHQRSEAQVEQLEQSGFNTSDDLQGTPGLLVSRSQQQIAIPEPSGYLRFDFDQVEGLKVTATQAEEHEYNHRLAITLKGQSRPVNVGYASEVKAEKALQQLQKIISR